MVDLMQLAIHEAGHAVFAVHLGVGVQFVKIEAQGGYCEYLEGHREKLHYDFPSIGEAYILSQMGGMVAEHRWAKENNKQASWWEGAWINDYDLICEGVEELFNWRINQEQDRSQEQYRLLQQANEMICNERIWSCVVAVANRLLRQSYLYGSVVDEIYKESSGEVGC